MSRSTAVPASVLLFAAATGLSGCGNSKAPSKAAFAAALEPVVRDVFCHPIDVMRYEVEGEPGGSGFPIVTSPKPTLAGQVLMERRSRCWTVWPASGSSRARRSRSRRGGAGQPTHSCGSR